MAELSAEQIALQKRRAFKKFSYRGVDLDKLLDLNHQVCPLQQARG